MNLAPGLHVMIPPPGPRDWIYWSVIASFCWLSALGGGIAMGWLLWG